MNKTEHHKKAMLESVDISDININQDNPRYIRDDKFKKLVQSIKEFPEMLSLRPIIVNDGMTVLGGNMRLRACQEAGLREVPIIRASDLTDEQQKEFIIKDNVGFGEWDWEILANEWDTDLLDDWGLELPKEKESIKGDVEFTEVLGEEHNYIVLYFDNEVDWLQVETLFDLKTVKALSTRKDGESTAVNERKGIGRVIKGSEALNKIMGNNEY